MDNDGEDECQTEIEEFLFHSGFEEEVQDAIFHFDNARFFFQNELFSRFYFWCLHRLVIDPRALAVVRIGFGLFVMASCLARLRDAANFYSDLV